MEVTQLSAREGYWRYSSEAYFKTEGTKDQYTPKINQFTEMHSDTDLIELLSLENIRSFLIEDTNPNIGIAALEHFYNFAHTDLLNVKHYLPFPINKDLKRELTKKKSKEEYTSDERANYLPRDFNFNELFNDKWYEHLNNKDIINELKACVAVCLGGAFDTSEISTLTISDFEITSNQIRVKNPYNNFNSSWIMFNEHLSSYILDYYRRRTSSGYEDNELFFIRLWDNKEARGIQYDSNLWSGKKPTFITQWVSYILKYISYNLGLNQRIETTSLRHSTILHYLYSTNGKGIDQLIRTFGWVNFIKDAIFKYFNEEDVNEISFVLQQSMEDNINNVDASDEEYFFQFPHWRDNTLMGKGDYQNI